MSVLKPFSHDVLKETVMSLPKHRVTVISRSKMAAKEAVAFLRTSEQRESRESARKIFINKYTGLIEQKRGEWPTQASMTEHTPALVESEQPVKTILDGEIEIDPVLLDSMQRELARDAGDSELHQNVVTPASNVIDIRAVRRTIQQSAVTNDEARARLVAVSVPEGERHERLSEAA